MAERKTPCSEPQGGPEPLDAYRQFLEECERRGDFVLLDEKLGAEFWRYYRDDSLHSFFPAGTPEEAAAFAKPPWLREESGASDH